MESRYLQYDKKAKKVIFLKSFTPRATVSRRGGRHMGSRSLILEDAFGAFTRCLCDIQA